MAARPLRLRESFPALNHVDRRAYAPSAIGGMEARGHARSVAAYCRVHDVGSICHVAASAALIGPQRVSTDHLFCQNRQPLLTSAAKPIIAEPFLGRFFVLNVRRTSANNLAQDGP